jgi:hypothetical protein
MGFVFPQPDGTLKLDLTDDWYDSFDDVCQTLSAAGAVRVSDMQIDNRVLHNDNEK